MATATGYLAEKLAAEYLHQHHVTILQHNFRCPLGEIDLIAQDQDVLLFIEVKFRSTDNYGHAAACLSLKQQRRISRAAQFFLQRYPPYRCECDSYRFDLLCITHHLQTPHFDWIQNAFHVI